MSFVELPIDETSKEYLVALNRAEELERELAELKKKVVQAQSQNYWQKNYSGWLFHEAIADHFNASKN